jgi:hypothetical protein
MSSRKKLSELEAMQVIHKALEPFDAEARGRILTSVISLLEVTNAPSFNGNTAVPSNQVLPTENSSIITPQMTIESFLKAKVPSDNNQRLACLAYYLEHHDNKPDVSTRELTKANSDARQMQVSNVSAFLDNATRRHGFFAPSGKGKKHLTIRGKAVVEALPNPEAVKEALKQHPMPQRSGRKARAKTKKR